MLYHRKTSHQGTAQFDYANGVKYAETLAMASDNKSFTVQQHVTGSQGTYDQTAVFDKSP